MLVNCLKDAQVGVSFGNVTRAPIGSRREATGGGKQTYENDHETTDARGGDGGGSGGGSGVAKRVCALVRLFIAPNFRCMCCFVHARILYRKLYQQGIQKT